MVGDHEDMKGRIRALLPARWFADSAPVLEALLAGLAEAWAWLHGMLAAVRAEARIATAAGSALDRIAFDFFGLRIRRRAGQADAAFRQAILRELLRERATRPALAGALLDLTGRAPVVFEPWRPGDTGGWGEGRGLAWGMAGGWGNLSLPRQAFVTAFRPPGSGIAGLSGWAGAAGGWGMGAIAWAGRDQVQGQVTDADIRAAVVAVLPVNAVAWLRIES